MALTRDELAARVALELRDGDGDIDNLDGKHRIFLCRCGGSTTKPFCDGTHSKIGFQGAIAAVEKADKPE